MWHFFRQNMSLISDAIDGKTNYTTTMCTTKGVRVTHFRGDPVVTFEETKTAGGKVYNTDIHLDRQAWANFVVAAVAVDDCLGDEIAYSINEVDDWHFREDDCHPLTSNPRRRLVPKLKDDVISMVLSTHLVSRAIQTKVQKACTGYGTNFLSQKQHTHDNCICLATWQEQVERFFHEAVSDLGKMADLQAAADKVNYVTGWRIKPTPISPELRQLVNNEKVGAVVGTYIKLFDNLCLFDDVTSTRSK